MGGMKYCTKRVQRMLQMNMRFIVRATWVERVEISKCTRPAWEARAREVMAHKVTERKVVLSKVRRMDSSYKEVIRVEYHEFTAKTLRASSSHALCNTMRYTYGATIASASSVLERWHLASHRPLTSKIEEEPVILNARMGGQAWINSQMMNLTK